MKPRLEENQVILFDLDGTLCDVAHRRRYVQVEPKNWGAFSSALVLDKPLPHVKFVHDLFLYHEYKIVYCSGRSDEYETQTRAWLNEHLNVPHPDLRMRRAKDRRPDDVVKKEILDGILADGLNPVFAFDDRTQVVDMWRANGIPCFQVAEGNF